MFARRFCKKDSQLGKLKPVGPSHDDDYDDDDDDDDNNDGCMQFPDMFVDTGRRF